MRRLSRLSILLIAVALTFSACSPTTSDSGSKILRIAKDTDIKTLDTSLATDGLSFDVIEQFTDGLLDYDKDGTLIPRIATALPEVSADGLTYTFTLREDAKWSNGDPVTANDFVFSWRRLADPATASEYNYMVQTAGILNADEVVAGTLPTTDLGVKADGDYKLVVTLSAPVPYFNQLMAFPVFNPLNEAFVTEKGDQYALSVDNVLSNGPFVLTSWTPGSGWELKKNEDYYDADSVEIDGLSFTVNSDYQSSVLQFENGELDVTKISSDLVSKYKDADTYVQVKLGYVWFLKFNVAKNEQLQNANLRLAIATALDRDNITQNIMKDGSQSATYIIPEGLASYEGNDFRKDVDAYLAYNVDTAKAYLEKAKTELGVTSFTFELLTEDSAEAKNNAAQIKSDLEEVGITVEITSIPKPERLERMNNTNMNYEIGLTRWGPDYADPFTYLGDNLSAANDNQIKAWNNATYNALVDSIAPGGSLSTDADARWEAMKEAESVLLSEAIIAPIWQSGESMLVSTKVTGIEIHVVGATAYRNVKIAD